MIECPRCYNDEDLKENCYECNGVGRIDERGL